MKLQNTKFPAVKIVLLEPFEDNRGYFIESYQKERFHELGINCEFVQDNLSYSERAGTIRGMHYQLQPYAQSKLISVISGSQVNIVVDIRRGSPTFGKWTSMVLTGEEKQALFIPKGFANGSCTLEHHTIVHYKVDTYYAPKQERAFIWNDQSLGIEWPTKTPIVSEKDGRAPTFDRAELNFVYEGE